MLCLVKLMSALTSTPPKTSKTQKESHPRALRGLIYSKFSSTNPTSKSPSPALSTSIDSMVSKSENLRLQHDKRNHRAMNLVPSTVGPTHDHQRPKREIANNPISFVSLGSGRNSKNIHAPLFYHCSSGKQRMVCYVFAHLHHAEAERSSQDDKQFVLVGLNDSFIFRTFANPCLQLRCSPFWRVVAAGTSAPSHASANMPTWLIRVHATIYICQFDHEGG